ncbi:MAG TPA: Hsp20/alpha crystallin family protein [Candidatus Aenigmarchaeota archaeon]|nr:MAG: hypothetical protein DRN75_03500 [Nanoarchaeota archaeon]HDO79815.1 Hsp20/alpha crystallin family protein [Candidatus Aenigmarchaeota archaeon]HEX32867.1 Hsp20/alpha crystallin family protein [Candidatus Aenigmarchaeota archaeon]
MRDIFDFFREMDRIFKDDFFTFDESISPRTDVHDHEDKYIVTFELPGVTKDDIDLNIYDNTIEVTAKREVKDYAKNRYSKESLSYHKVVRLPEEIDADNVKATYKNGILEITVPKKTVKKKKVRIDEQ